MPSEHPNASPRSLTPVEHALLDAALKTGYAPNPSFLNEIEWRLNRAMQAMDCLANVFSNASFHQFDLPAEGLYGMADLILSELKIVQVLCERRDDIAPRTAGEVAP